ncbi:hypothetical protein OBBRIDRAFT_189310 [Obba rivulosa]|uniref:Uncharacterized protein n=1 Tax=Obba rivulosa TaxID=1052685 RepID=A0A8E2ALY5_9APHY|nr:hypothetical protein OBBRIDRAFT_189310 [Obba rivulosa]
MKNISIRQSAIKRPKVREITGMQHALGLTNGGYSVFSDIMRKLLQEYCDTTKAYKYQDPKQLERFRREALQECPMLEQYEGCWPLDIWVKWRLRRVSHERRRQRARNHRSRDSMNRNDDIDEKENAALSSEDLGEQHHEATQRCASVMSYGPSRAHGHDELLRNLSSSMLSSSGSLYNKRTVGSNEDVDTTYGNGNTPGPACPSGFDETPGSLGALTDVLIDHEDSIQTPSRPASSSRSMLAFLQALTPNLEALLPNFVAAGVKDSYDNLQGLLALSDNERNKLFRLDMNLTCFQARILAAGLAELKD